MPCAIVACGSVCGGFALRSAGCDSKRLFIASANTFGTITSAIFKIAVQPHGSTA